MPNHYLQTSLGLGIVSILFPSTVQAQFPLLTSWPTSRSAVTAEVVEYTGGSPVSTWPAVGLTNTGGGQATPVYSDVQTIRYSSNFVYVTATGLASYDMGPWYISPGVIFGNWPSAQNWTYKFPRTPQPASGTRTKVGLGNIGLMVNGCGMFNGLDAFSYDTSAGVDAATNGPPVGNKGDGIWNRSAIAAEVATFDPAYAHQPQNGQYHYHGNPKGLRFQLSDNISYNPTSKVYTEASSGFTHSPILGWALDGYPVYGPYGYSVASSSTSTVSRMRSGFTARDGNNGTTNLASTGRRTLPPWAATLHGQPQNLASTLWGPNVSTGKPLGWYAEDYDYLGDLGFTQGTDFDLDKYNGRFCVTPEFPAGTYAYFCTVNSSGTPVYPFTIGNEYYGQVTGGTVSTISEPTTLHFQNTGAAGISDWKSY